MADKLITQLQLISNLTDTVNVPGDNGTQTYRFTMAQLFAWMRSKFGYAITVTGTGTTLTSSNVIVFLDPTSASFTQNLPACASLPTGTVLKFKNIATNGNIVTLDADSTELIERAQTLDLMSDPISESVSLYNTGTKWVILP